MDSIAGPDGEVLYVNRTEGTRGSKAPFYVVYADGAGDRRWGFRCENCGSADNAVDSMGRIECNVCANRTKAEEWDAAHE